MGIVGILFHRFAVIFTTILRLLITF